MIKDILDSAKPNNHQRLAVSQGAAFHQECIRSLSIAGFEISEQEFTIREVGIKLDAITNNAHGIAMPWEFKGSWNGARPGLRRTDTLKKAIANGYLLSRWENKNMMTPLLVMTTHFPEDGSGIAMLRTVDRNTVMAFVDSRDTRLLGRLYRMTEEELHSYIDAE